MLAMWAFLEPLPYRQDQAPLAVAGIYSWLRGTPLRVLAEQFLCMLAVVTQVRAELRE